MPSRRLSELTRELAVGDADPWVRGITLDSRQVGAGDLYVALPGRTTHGARFAPQAVAAGAVGVLTDPAGVELLSDAGLVVPVLAVADPRASMGDLAAELYSRPADALTMIGITGTNGKTTATFMVEALLQAAGRRVGTIGTLGFRLDGADLGGARTTVTTPESVDLHALLALLRERGADTVVMEVSSHALDLQRVAGISFDAAGFTNLGRDHLDFHHTMEAYFRAKAALFEPARSRRAVINIDDGYGRRLAEQVRSDGVVALVTVSSAGDPAADWRVTDRQRLATGGSRARIVGPAGELDAEVRLLGSYNVDNALVAVALVSAVGIEPAQVAPALATTQIPGRMQPVELGAGAPTVIVDFAHTPQAVAAALAAVSGAQPAGPAPARVIVVLGCGGNRDRLKREPMGAAAATGADVVVVTDDNPRGEEPASIRAQVLAGARAAAGRGRATVVDGGDRRAAIRTALAEANAGDLVAVLGKGHEHGQEVAGVVHPFDDVQVIIRTWAELHPEPVR